jgi:P27 family predicted phage terminase small subunit
MRPVPPHLKVLTGNPGKRRIAPGIEPEQPENLPEPPPFLNEDAANEWWRVAGELRTLRLLTALDIAPLAAYCQSYAHWVMAERLLAEMAARDPARGALLVRGTAGSAMPNPLLKIARLAAEDMVRYAAEFGLTPRARTHLSGSFADRAPSKFGELLG